MNTWLSILLVRNLIWWYVFIGRDNWCINLEEILFLAFMSQWILFIRLIENSLLALSGISIGDTFWTFNVCVRDRIALEWGWLGNVASRVGSWRMVFASSAN
jgi:hypothetical protein